MSQDLIKASGNGIVYTMVSSVNVLFENWASTKKIFVSWETINILHKLEEPERQNVNGR